MASEPTLDDVVHDGRLRLAAAGVGSPDSDAVALAAHVLGVEDAEARRRMILRHPTEPAFRDRFTALVRERAARVPLQHLTGRAHFRRLTLQVGPGVFVPRPETELVAGLAIEAARAAGPRPRVVDLCTGSGAIALSVADEVPAADVYAVELDPAAHAWAERNIEACALAVGLTLGDARTAYPGFDGTVDVVVSNPPYIPDGMVPVDPEVRDHDPEVALYGQSEDGLAVPLAVASRAAELLRPGGTLVMEHADAQGETLPAALARAGVWRDIVDHRDLTGRPRASVAVRRS